MLFNDLRSKDRPWGKWFRLGQWQLPESEISLIRAYFRLYAQNPGFRWNFVEEPPFDALLIDESVTDINSVLKKFAPRISMLVTWEQKNNSGSFLQRPLRSDNLEKWLRRIEYEISQQESSSERSVLTSDASSTIQAANSALPTFSRPTGMGGDEKPASHSSEYFKLRRWPPAMLLQKNPVRTRLATMLLRRAMRLEEMTAITQRPLQECVSFLNLLKNSGLIEVYAEAVPIPQPQPSASKLQSEEEKMPKIPVVKGFIAMFRRKLRL